MLCNSKYSNSGTDRPGSISMKREELDLSADDGMSVVSPRTADTESERNLLDRTVETKDFGK